ncbi:MAG TPA: ABC transporter ATP-binding protein [Fimbriimonadaceae bacterium]|nr:ABC transporter ATP-binding protein [Fimbriimonadaceae bacterium]HRJ33916.1 ABC transporter ATP-binding protein [Fimbriimonadaceae bacterium]
MSPPILEVRGLEKEFQLSHSGAGSLKTMLLWWNRRTVERLAVLRGIDLTVMPGECVALVGRNGAGKSTLLSLLARIYKPTRGTIEVRGRMAPLLELGAGFHPDLTGYENVVFNGVVLGLTRAEVRARMDQIVAFAELERHIDAPVRTYSSGMMARLGFSVAVHVDADILIVDEVLAVGDYAFEQKCYERIESFRQAGGTILFVSHQLDSVLRVADRCVWLKDGLIHASGKPEEIVEQYRMDAT